MHETLYLGLDAHTRTCVLAAIDQSGERVSATEFSTSESGLIHEVTRLQGQFKYLALEESSLAGWVAGVLRPHVTHLIVCNPFHNALISQSNRKDDFTDSYKLARLLRLDELTSVYHTDEDHRIDFKMAVQQYLSFVEHLKRLNLQLRAKYHQAGIFNMTGTKVLSKRTRDLYLNE
ncbi:MAG: transposase [Bacteroidetes bacterium]|nr:transposase [Bacteroidota bacterium]